MTPLSSKILGSIVDNQSLLSGKQDDDDLAEKGPEPDSPPPALSQRRWCPPLPPTLCLITGILATIFIVAIIANIGLDKLSSHEPPSNSTLDCGSTPTEAISKGCIF